MKFTGRSKGDGDEPKTELVTISKTEMARKEETKIVGAGEVKGVNGTLLREISEDVLSQIDPTAISDVGKAQLLEAIEILVATACEERSLQINTLEQKNIAKILIDDMVGHGPLDVLLEDESVTEIMVNGPVNIFIERNGKTMLSDVKFRDEAHLMTIAKRIARSIGRRLDEQVPLVDARLLDGSRVNIAASPISLDGTTISIRKFPKERLMLKDLQKFGALSVEMAKFIECISNARCNILVSGGTSSGKTTILNSLSDFIRPTERVITIEDSAELKLDIPNLVRLETRVAGTEAGSKPITQRDLVANSLRMRPDRIILGEVRREEAFDLLQAMGTGHDGSMGTLHSNDPRDTCRRLENMILMGGFELPTRVVRSQIVSSVDFIIHAARGADGKRRVTHITEVTGLEGETISLQDVFLYEVDDKGGSSSGEYVSNPVNLRASGKLREYGRLEDAMEAVLSAPRSRESDTKS
jgi:pilus assembly protein CpaF